MDYVGRLIKYLMAIILSFFGVLFEFPSSGEANLDCLKFDLRPPQEEVLTIERSLMTDGEMTMITSLQGITAQNYAKIYIRDGDRSAYLEDYLAANPEIREIAFTDPWSLVEECMDDLADKGMIVFTKGDDPSANMAATVAGVERWLTVESADAQKAEAIGLVEKRNFTKLNKGLTDPQEAVFNEYKDRLNNTFLLHQPYELVTTRDYAIATKSPVIFTSESDLTGKLFRAEVFSWMEKNSPIFGWTTNEGQLVNEASQYGLFVVAADHATNLSFLAAIGSGETQTQPNQPESIETDPDKHYIALVISDGDNLQYYYNTVPFAGSHYAKRQETDTSYKMSWTAPPLANRASPGVLERVYGMASENDSFVCGVSGAGYINPGKYPKSNLGNFAKLTNSVMAETGMSVVCLLDNMSLFNSSWLTGVELGRAYKYFAEQPNIDGGLLQIGDRYQELGGKIIWSNEKPFISCRLSMWEENMTDDWVRDFAARINALPADNTSENGYTYLNIHPWSASMEHVNLLVSLLDDHIELVTAEELVQLVTDNVKY